MGATGSRIDGSARERSGPARPPVALVLPVPPAGVGRVHGLPRSGNHAVIKWILRNLPHRDHVFLNNCAPFRDPMAHHGEAEVNGGRVRQKMRAQGDCGPALARLTGEDGPFLLMSYERWVPSMEPEGDGRLSRQLDDGRIDFQVLVYRSPLNWLASLLVLQRRRAEARGAPEAADGIVATQLARYQGMLVALHRDALPGITPVCYDRWFASAAHRAALLQTLGLPVRDNRLGRVSNYGGGSSFQDLRNADGLGVLSRWMELMPDPGYRAHLAQAAQNEAFMAAMAALFPVDADVMASERL
ncbi:hypothetical protein GE300_08070 [Rhodobacteraceae bacterium 2CG4]|uniref:Sulfotransferase family protein n=1 Tax=Halovulum marinum TaxID=2662447 RepID=A0A6L5YZ29_9RHOB|nr:hypothetical protein [Halovulum marinum]MSU89571.1 hypothetical protein [Halovulum marinum]